MPTLQAKCPRNREAPNFLLERNRDKNQVSEICSFDNQCYHGDTQVETCSLGKEKGNLTETNKRFLCCLLACSIWQDMTSRRDASWRPGCIFMGTDDRALLDSSCDAEQRAAPFRRATSSCWTWSFSFFLDLVCSWGLGGFFACCCLLLPSSSHQISLFC